MLKAEQGKVVCFKKTSGWCLWHPDCYVTVTWMGRRLVHKALDYIIQVHDGDFHVYFRANLFFELTGEHSERKEFPSMTLCFFLKANEDINNCSEKMSSWKMLHGGSICINPTREIQFFLFFFFFFWVQTHWGSDQAPEAPTPPNSIQSRERARETRDCRKPVREEEVVHHFNGQRLQEEQLIWALTVSLRYPLDQGCQT